MFCLTLIVYHIRAYFQGKMGGCYLAFRVGSRRIIKEGAAILQLPHLLLLCSLRN